MRGSLAVLVLSLVACDGLSGSGPPGATPGPTPAPPLVEQMGDADQVTSALGASVFVPTLESLDEGDCSAQVRALRRRLLATELLYEGVPQMERHAGAGSVTPPVVTTPPGEEFAAFDYALWVSVGRDGIVTPLSTAPGSAGSPRLVDDLRAALRTVAGSPEGEALPVLLRADRHAPGEAVRNVLKALRDLDVPYVGLLYSRPMAAGFERARESEEVAARRAEAREPMRNADAVFTEDCPVDWGVVAAAAPRAKMGLWIEAAVRGVEDCDCIAAPRDVVWLYEAKLNPALSVAIPVDVRGTAGARPLVIGDGRPWGPAAKALYNAIRIDPRRPRSTPVVLDLDAAPAGLVPKVVPRPSPDPPPP